MWNPFHRKPKLPIEPRLVDVGRVEIHIVTNDGSQFRVELHGTYHGPSAVFDDGDIIITAEERFWWWQERAGETSMARVGVGMFVPLCNIKKITRTLHPFQVKATTQ